MSQPPTASNAFADLFGQLGPTRGLDYSIAKNLHRLGETAGILDARAVDHQPACITNEHRHLLKWTVEEAAPSFVRATLITEEQLASTLLQMQQAVDTPDVTIFAPRMYFVSCVKA